MIFKATVLATGLLLFIFSRGWGGSDLRSLLAERNPVFFGFPDNEVAAGAELQAVDINPASLSLIPSEMFLLSYTASSGGGERRRLAVPVLTGSGFVVAAGLEDAHLAGTGHFDGSREDAYSSGAGEIALGWMHGPAGIGISAHQATDTLGSATADRSSLDAGGILKTGDDGRTCLGLAVNAISLGDGLPGDTANVPQETTLTLGRQFLDDGNLFASLNAVRSTDEAWSLSAGTALKIQPAIETWAAIFRAGYTHAYDNDGTGQGISAGAGLLFDDIVFSYTFNSLAAGGLSHALGISYSFAQLTVTGDSAAKIAAGKQRPVADQGAEQEEKQDINRIMKDLCRETLAKIDRDRDTLIFTHRVTSDDLKDLDDSRNIVVKLMMENKYDEAWTLLKYLYRGYVYLDSEIAARELLKETEARSKKVNDARSYHIEFYKKGLQEYVKGDMASVIASMNRYIDAGGQFYKEKARRILAAAYLKSGMDGYTAGAVSAAAILWRNGLKNEPLNAELNRCMKEYIEPKCNDYFNAGMVAYAQGDMRKAESLWKACLEIDPEDQRAKKALQRLK